MRTAYGSEPIQTNPLLRFGKPNEEDESVYDEHFGGGGFAESDSGTGEADSAPSPYTEE